VSARRWLPPVAWAALILLLTSIPGPDLPQVGVHGTDKVAHLTMYGIFAWLFARSVLRGNRLVRGVVMVVLTVSLFGAADEWHQQYIPGRSMELFDWMSDTLGAALGASAAAVVLRRREERA
jgi:VanZ family protein